MGERIAPRVDITGGALRTVEPAVKMPVNEAAPPRSRIASSRAPGPDRAGALLREEQRPGRLRGHLIRESSTERVGRASRDLRVEPRRLYETFQNLRQVGPIQARARGCGHLARQESVGCRIFRPMEEDRTT